jgi:hypothetical protein
MPRVMIYRASKDGLSGEITPIGMADLPIKLRHLNAQVKRPPGNGAASPYVDDRATSVLTFRIGDFYYVAQKAAPWDVKAGARWSVVIHHDNDAVFHSPPKPGDITLLSDEIVGGRFGVLGGGGEDHCTPGDRYTP